MKRLVFLIGLVATVAVLPFPMLSGPRSQASAAVFTQVSAGGYHTCSVRTDSTLACWGDNTYGQATPPAVTFSQVSAGLGHTCGVKTDGTLACWGYNGSGQATPPAVTFTQVSANVALLLGFTCGVKTDGTLACWGDNTYGQATPPAAPVGGIAELPVFAGTSAEETGAPAEGSGWPAGDYAALAGGLAAAALLIAVGGTPTARSHLTCAEPFPARALRTPAARRGRQVASRCGARPPLACRASSGDGC
jgi:hypothetical protein